MQQSLPDDATGTGDSRSQSVQSENDFYKFSIQRRSESAPWMVNSVGELPKISRDERRRNTDTEIDIRQSWLDHDTQIGGVFLADLLQDRAFRVKTLQPVLGAGRTCVRVEFDYAPASAIEPDGLPLRGGWFILDPDVGWRIRSAEAQLQHPGAKYRAALEIEYGTAETTDQDHVIRRISSQTTRASDGYVIMSTMDFLETTFREVPLAEFRLSAYGLPELGRPSSSPRYFGYILVNVAIVLLIVSVVIYRRRRSRPIDASS